MVVGDRIYLDHNATTPVDPEVFDAMLPYLQGEFGNPSSIHHFGRRARRALDRAREQVAAFLGAEPSEIVFTSGGTEANNAAIAGAVASRGGSVHVLTSVVEHQAALNPCRHLAERGHRVTFLPVDEQGLVDGEGAKAAFENETALVTLMLANNDVGTLQPVQALAEAARARGILVHSDAVQALGKIPVKVGDLGIDLLSLSSHKIYGPKGVGALWIRKGLDHPPLLLGGHHERRRRAGTENVPGIVGFGKACALMGAHFADDAVRMGRLRDRLEAGLLARLADFRVNGHPELRLSNTASLSFPGLDGEAILMNLDLLGIAVSTGSACTSGTAEPSYVLTAMGRSNEEARSSLRFSLGRGNTEEEIDRVIDAVTQVVESLLG